MNHNEAHLGIINGALGSATPGILSRFVIGENAHDLKR